MPQFNQLNVAETAGRGRNEKQVEEFNALRMDATKQRMGQQKTAFDEETRMLNTKWLAGAAQYGMQNPDSIPMLLEEGKRRGVLDPSLTAEGIDPGQLQGIYEGAMAGLGGPEYTDVSAEDVPYAQRNREGQVSMPGATPKGPTAPMQNIVERERRVAAYGEGSPEVRAFDNYVRANQFQTINQVPTKITPSGQQPLSTLESEAEAANRIKMAEGEGGRGRTQQPGGEFAPVAGTEADVKQKEAERKRAGGAFMKSIQAQTVTEDVGRLNDLLAKDVVPLGRLAATQERLPIEAQTDGYRNAKSLIESVKGNVGIDSLLRIKATGAGLGQVPQSQLDLLSRLLGELDMTQEKSQFIFTWNRMGAVYETIMMQADAELEELGQDRPQVSSRGGGVDEAAMEQALGQAREAIAAGKSRTAIEKMLRDMGIDPSLL